MQRHRIYSVIPSLDFPTRQGINNDLPEVHSVLKNAEGQGLPALALNIEEILLPGTSFPEMQSLGEGGLGIRIFKAPHLIHMCSQA